MAEEGGGAPAAQAMLTDAYLVAKAYFDLGEYERAAAVLTRRGTAKAAAQQRPRVSLNPLESFLRLYAVKVVPNEVPVSPRLAPVW